MNYHQIKQWLENNLWYGEQGRPPQEQTLATALIEPDYTKRWYIDISDWDGGAVQLGVTKALGCSGVWIKGVDGSLNSKHFPANYATAVQVGLPRSAYAWLYRDVNVRATAQAQAFDTLLNKYPPSPELTPLIDFESTRYGGVSSNPDFTDLRKWLVEWLRLGNPKPILYGGKYYMDQFGAMPSDVRDMIEGLHIANYSTLNPPLPFGFTTWIYHQFASIGNAMKIAPNNVNKLELDLNYGHGTVIPPPPPTGATMKSGTLTTNTTSLKIRSTPVALADNSNQIGGIYQGDTAFGEIDAASGWLHVSSIKRANDTSQTIDGYCSANPIYITLVDVPPAPTHRHLVEVFIDGKLEFTKALE